MNIHTKKYIRVVRPTTSHTYFFPINQNFVEEKETYSDFCHPLDWIPQRERDREAGW